ncbi:Protein mono-ADP-ribosyltransferase parp4 [Chamberlinius hualienensis]
MKLKKVKKGIFIGTTFAVCQGTATFEAKSKLRKKITSNDGVISYIVTKKCYCLILLDDGSSSSSGNHIRSARKYGVPIVSELFIDNCVDDQSLLSPSNFIISFESTVSKGLNDSFKNGKIPILETENSRLSASSSSARHVKVWDYLDPSMPAFYDNPYTLAKFTLLKGQSLISGETIFGTVEIHVQTKTTDDYAIPRYCLFCFIGSSEEANIKRRIGSGKTTSRTCRFTNESSVVLENYSKQIQALMVPPRSLSICDVITESIQPFVGSTEFQKILDTLSVTQDQIDPEIKRLVADIWKDTFGSVGINQPIDQIKVSLKDVDEAENILIEIANLIDRGSTNEIDELVKKYHALIPQQSEADLSSKTNLSRQKEFLQLFRDVLGVAEANPDGIVGAYKALNCRITKVHEESEEYTAVLNKIKENGAKVQIHNIFAVRRTVEDDHFKFDIPNKQILFHGSAFKNFLGILSRGLLPSKFLSVFENEEIYGKLGSGIYFTNSLIAGAGYTAAGITRGSRLIAVAEVALGKCYETSAPSPYLTSPPNDYNSVHGLIGDHFNNDEFVVYDACQQRLTHLIEFTLPGDELSKSAVKTEIDDHNLWSSKAKTDLKTLTSESLTLENILALKEEQLGSIKWRLESQNGEKIPLRAVHVRSRIIDLAANVVIIQEYFKRSTTTLKETKFIFPLNDETAVCGFEAFIGSKHIVGEVQEKKKAHQMYKEAVEKGHGGYLMDEEKEETFSVTVGNLPPMTAVVIKITFVTELATEGEHMAFRLPKGITKKGMRESVEVGIEMLFPIRRISSPLNRIEIKKTETMATVRLAAGENLLNGFELIIELAEIHVPRMWVEDHPEKSSQACMLAFYPAFEMESSVSSDSTVIIMLDASNSMRGDLFTMAKIIAMLCIRKIPSDWNFNVIIFGSVWKELFATSQPKSLVNAAAAQEFIEKATADMGCTDVLLPLKSLMLLAPPEGQLQNVFVISDGYFRNSSHLMAATLEFQLRTRIFTLGIGSAKFPCDKHALKKLAYKGSGAFEDFDLKINSKWMKKIDYQLQKVAQPVLTDVNVEWQLFDNDSPAPVQSPIKFPPIFHGSRQLVYGFVSHCNLVTLKAKVRGIEVTTIVSTSDLAKTQGKILHELTARALIRDWNEGLQDDDCLIEKDYKIAKKWEIIELSKTHGILSPLTSFVAIEARNKEKIDKQTNAIIIDKLLKAEDVDRISYIEYPFEEGSDRRPIPESLESEIEHETLEINTIEMDCAWEMQPHQKRMISATKAYIKPRRLTAAIPSQISHSYCEMDEDFAMGFGLFDNCSDSIYEELPDSVSSLFHVEGAFEERTMRQFSDTSEYHGNVRGLRRCGIGLLMANDEEDELPKDGNFRSSSREKDTIEVREGLDKIGTRFMLSGRKGPPPKKLFKKKSVNASQEQPKNHDDAVSYLSQETGSDDIGCSKRFAQRAERSEHFEFEEELVRKGSTLPAKRDSDFHVDFASAFPSLISSRASCGALPVQLSSAAIETAQPLSVFGGPPPPPPSTIFRTPPPPKTVFGTPPPPLAVYGASIPSPVFGTPPPPSSAFGTPIQSIKCNFGIQQSTVRNEVNGAARACLGFKSMRPGLFISDSIQCASSSIISSSTSNNTFAAPIRPPITIRRKIEKLPSFCPSSAPICVAIMQNLIDDKCDLLSDSVKAILKKGWGSTDPEFKSFIASMKTKFHLDLAKTAEIPNKNGQPSDRVSDSCATDKEVMAALDGAGIKSLGKTARSFILLLCSSLKDVLKMLITAGADLTKSFASTESQIREWAEQLLNAMYVIDKEDVLILVMAISTVLKICATYPLIFKTLQLKNSFNVENWEAFVVVVYRL